VTFQARSLQSALRRCVLASEGWREEGPYAWLRIDGDQQRMRVLMHGWAAAAAEWVPCTYSGPAVEIALPFHHLSSAIGSIDGDVVLSFGDPSKPVVIEYGDSYRCVLRPLPPAPPDSPAHRTFFQNVPFPK